jgi:heat shock protein beta
MMSIIF